MTGRRAALEERLARGDPGGLVYGALVTAAVLAVVSSPDSHATHVALTVFGVLVVYWLAHVYVETQAMQFDGDGRHLHHRVRSAAREETSVLVGGLPALVVYALANLLAVETSQAALVALWFSVVFLVLVGYLGAHRAGMTGWRLAVESAAAGAFGVVAVLAKELLH